MRKKLNVAFVLHMHQPLYKDPFTGEYALPWVLFHATKDYYDMAAILEEFPHVHQTLNLVPCLIEQLNEYGSGKASDKYRKLSLKAASKLTRDDKEFLLQNFFQANIENMIKPLPRFGELLKKRGLSSAKEDVASAVRYFNEQDFLDIQVLFNLAWIDPEIVRKDALLLALADKGRGFSEHEKAQLLARQIDIVNMVVPKYKELMEKGIIEASTSPYYHPILPLLCDSYSAKEAMPDAELPRERFIHPEDALEQIKRGIALYEKTFGRKPKGFWPSEGSVSMDILPLLKGEGIEWFATDEEILSNSLKRSIRRDSFGNCLDPFLYRPYQVDGMPGLSAVFRDHVISDLIGFDYARYGAEDAANDLITRLHHIAGLVTDPESHLVSIILDGENAWENFRNDGRDFLCALYSKLGESTTLKCVTVSEFLNTRPHDRERIQRLFAGSWINHNFRIWIGHHEDNTAWDYIYEAREALVKFEEAVKNTSEYAEKKAQIQEAWECVYAAEGSDWFWWYGEEHSSMSDEDFDALFRRQIKKIYALIGIEPPIALEIPISMGIKGQRPPSVPTAFMRPVMDGEVTNYFEWMTAGSLERSYFGTAMHRVSQGGGLIEAILYGFSKDALFLRFDYLRALVPFKKKWSLTITFISPASIKLEALINGNDVSATIFERSPETHKWSEKCKTGPDMIAAGTVVELGIPFSALGASYGHEVRFFISIDAGEVGFERWPVKGFLILDIPPEDFEQHNWKV